MAADATRPAGEGWRLVNQTNSLSTGLNLNTNAWFTVPGGVDGSNSITMDPNQVPVFPIGLPSTIMANDRNPMPA